MNITKTKVIILAFLFLGSIGIFFLTKEDTEQKDLPSGYIELEQIEFLKINQSINQVYSILGEPFEDLASGMYHLVYKMENDKYKELHVVLQPYLVSAYLVDHNDETTPISLKTIPEEDIEDVELEVIPAGE